VLGSAGGGGWGSDGGGFFPRVATEAAGSASTSAKLGHGLLGRRSVGKWEVGAPWRRFAGDRRRRGR
jgi:hypothetical protein